MKHFPFLSIILVAALASIQLSLAQNVLEVTASADPKDACTGQTVQLDVEVEGGLGSYAYTWTSDPPGFSSTLRDPEVNPLVTTTYTVDVADGTHFGSGQVVVSVYPYPQVQLGNDTLICEGDSVVFHAGSGFSTYLWQDGSSAQSFTATQTGIYWVEVASEFGCTGRDSVYLTVNSLPAKPAKPAGPSLVNTSITTATSYLTSSAASLTGYTWELQPEEAGILEQFNDSARVNWDTLFYGTAWIRVMTRNDCGSSVWSDSLLIKVQSPNGLNEYREDTKLEVFPNPCGGHFTLRLPGSKAMNGDLHIFSLAGRMVYQQPGLNLDGNSLHEIHVTHLPAGIYSLVLTDDKHYILRCRIILF